MPGADVLLFTSSSSIVLRYVVLLQEYNQLDHTKVQLQAFIAVLKVRFKDIGLRKIEKGQFALEDTARQRSLRLSDPWGTIVRPGQHISMSMVFRLQESPKGSCPSCGRDNEESDKAEVEW